LGFFFVVSDLLKGTRMVRRRQTKSVAVAGTTGNGEGSHGLALTAQTILPKNNNVF